MYEDFLFLVPARGGSKGIPKKNIRDLNGRPLIFYTLDSIVNIATTGNICVSTDDLEIIKKVEQYGIRVPFVRPSEISTDTSTSLEVMEHAINFYRKEKREFRGLVLLQPTSPFRTAEHIIESLELFSEQIDAVVSVKVTSANPYFVLFEENSNGFLEPSKKSSFTRRQDCPMVYERNGAIYIYNIQRFNSKMTRQKKFLMNESDSIDLDTDFDWMLAEFVLSTRANQR